MNDNNDKIMEIGLNLNFCQRNSHCFSNLEIVCTERYNNHIGERTSK